MVALTPSKDNFRKKCIIATVAARPLDNVKATPSQIDIFFARPEEIEIDPQQEFIMIEARSGYYEGTRYTLKALQKLHQERSVISTSNEEFEADIVGQVPACRAYLYPQNRLTAPSIPRKASKH